MESIIPEWELSKRVTVSSRSNLGAPRVRCDSNSITQKRWSRLPMRLSLDGNRKGFKRLWGCLQMRLSLDGNQKGFKRLWGCWFMIVIWPSVYIQPYGIYNPWTRTIQESDSIFQKQSRSARSQVRFKLHHSEKRIKVTYAAFFGWKSKGIRETLGVLIYDRHLAICVYPPLWNLWFPNENYPREWRYPWEAI